MLDVDPRELQPLAPSDYHCVTDGDQGTTFKAGVRFLSFDYIKNLLMDENGKLSPARGMVAGMAAGAFESIIAVTPTERVKTAL